jgi:hypothetical protein
MKIMLRDIHMERDPLRGPYDVLLGVVADLQLIVGDRLLYEESMMPVVELALSLRKWLHHGFKQRLRFSYDSIESDERGLLWIEPSGSGWRVGALEQEYLEMTAWGDDQIAEAFGQLIDEVDLWIAAHLSLDLDRVERTL